MSLLIASDKVAAGAGEASIAAAASNKRRVIRRSLFGGDELNQVRRRFKSRARHHHPPARLADALDKGGDVAVRVIGILHGARLVAEHQSAEKDLAQRVVGEN